MSIDERPAVVDARTRFGDSNKLIRQYIPKGTDFHTLSDDYILSVQTELNLRPRKLLNFDSPKSKFLPSLHHGVALRSRIHKFHILWYTFCEM